MAQPHTRERFYQAKDLMDSFAERTGVRKSDATKDRYLWTDAFAVQTFISLSHIFNDPSYLKDAYILIDLVHENLGKFHPGDPRRGWISGLPEEAGKKRPTAGGLRIGKNLPERKEHEPFNESLEWDRDGQYFHYLTRWIFALLLAGQESGQKKYLLWAADLLIAGSKFIYPTGTGPRMYWKMSTDLSRPLVTGMGSHDALEGFICARSIKEDLPEKEVNLGPVLSQFEAMCKNKTWITSDPLGIGGLLLNTLKAQGFNNAVGLPASVKPEKLLRECLISLEDYTDAKETAYPAHRRLAFRECGLSLGLRSFEGNREKLQNFQPSFELLQNYIPLAGEIENFWLRPEHQEVSTWTEHLNINSVSLAASLVAQKYPQAFTLE